MSFSKQNLQLLLKELSQSIENNQLDEEIQKELWDYLTWNKQDPENKEMVKYLFTGWWLHTQSGVKGINQ